MAKLGKKKLTLQKIIFAVIIIAGAAFAAWAAFGRRPYKQLHGLNWGGCNCGSCQAARAAAAEEDE